MIKHDSYKRFMLSLLIIFSSILYSQNLRISYQLILLPNKNDLKYKEKDILFLDILKEKSFFYSPTYNAFNGNVGEFDRKEDKDAYIASLKTSYTIEKNIKKNKIIYYFKYDNFYAYEEELKFKWEIIDEFKDIIGYRCQKAKTDFRGREYCVWFSEKISISDGPFKFYGLPGLILEVESKDKEYHFIANGIEKINDTEVDLPTKVKLQKRDKYLVFLKELADNPSKSMMAEDMLNNFEYDTFINGVKVNKNEKYKYFNEMIWNFMKLHNNPIEKDDIWIR